MTEKQTTACSNAHCYEKAALTNDPSHPPFCPRCRARRAGFSLVAFAMGLYHSEMKNV